MGYSGYLQVSLFNCAVRMWLRIFNMPGALHVFICWFGHIGEDDCRLRCERERSGLARDRGRKLTRCNRRSATRVRPVAGAYWPGGGAVIAMDLRRAH